MKVVNLRDYLAQYRDRFYGEKRKLLDYMIEYPEYVSMFVGLLPNALYPVSEREAMRYEEEAKKIIEWLEDLTEEETLYIEDYVEELIAQDREKMAATINIKFPDEMEIKQKEKEKIPDVKNDYLKKYFELVFGKAYGDAVAALATIYSGYRFAAEEDRDVRQELESLLSALGPSKEQGNKNDVVPDDDTTPDLSKFLSLGDDTGSNPESGLPADILGGAQPEENETKQEEPVNQNGLMDLNLNAESDSGTGPSLDNTLSDLSSVPSDTKPTAEDVKKLIEVVKNLLEIFTYFYTNYQGDKRRLMTMEARLFKLFDIVEDLGRVVSDVVERFVGTYTKLPIESSNTSDLYMGAVNLLQKVLSDVDLVIDLEYDSISITKNRADGIPVAGVVNVKAKFYDPEHRIEKVMKIPVYIIEGFFESPRFGVDDYGEIIPLTRKGIRSWLGVEELDNMRLEGPYGTSSATDYPKELTDVFYQYNPYPGISFEQGLPENNYGELYKEDLVPRNNRMDTLTGLPDWPE